MKTDVNWKIDYLFFYPTLALSTASHLKCSDFYFYFYFGFKPSTLEAVAPSLYLLWWWVEFPGQVSRSSAEPEYYWLSSERVLE